MQISSLNNMKNGWFIGNFSPTLLKTNDVEVAIKKYKKGDYEEAHFHKISTEITIVINGKVKMKNRILNMNDIILLNPGEITDFLALEDSVCAVVKHPGANNDKYKEDMND